MNGAACRCIGNKRSLVNCSGTLRRVVAHDTVATGGGTRGSGTRGNGGYGHATDLPGTPWYWSGHHSDTENSQIPRNIMKFRENSRNIMKFRENSRKLKKTRANTDKPEPTRTNPATDGQTRPQTDTPGRRRTHPWSINTRGL